MRLGLALAVLTLVAVAAAPPAAPGDRRASLEARAILPADARAPAPFPAARDTDPTPAPGATQPVGGFSALVDDGAPNTFWAMPDNGFGTKANSRSFLLRVYRLRADFETSRGGPGTVDILRWITLRDPDRKVPFAIVNQEATDRLLTGADFDVESMRVDRDGNLWFGDEFGPFLLHTDAQGRVLEAPIPLPDVKSPEFPADGPAPFPGPANLGPSNGFEGMAISPDRRTLYPVLEGPVTGDDGHVRRMYEFDLASKRYTERRRHHGVADPAYLVSDLAALDPTHLVALERDNFGGVSARHKRGFVVDLRATGPDGVPPKREVVNLLNLADPHTISLPARSGDIGLGDPFSMPYVTIESVLRRDGGRLAIVNDTNFGSRGRNPDLPDYSDVIVVRVPGLRGGASR